MGSSNRDQPWPVKAVVGGSLTSKSSGEVPDSQRVGCPGSDLVAGKWRSRADLEKNRSPEAPAGCQHAPLGVPIGEDLSRLKCTNGDPGHAQVVPGGQRVVFLVSSQMPDNRFVRSLGLAVEVPAS
uniref:Bm12708 n=1 Tax=Brugia malayi TaxID=6279 RepID=A0A1I9GDW4_BRUMA|nr:Bm12708 [Brugia malayi]